MSDINDEKELSVNVGDSSQQPQQKERRKIEIKFIQDKTRRHITFSKRKHGIMKKAYELSVLTGTQVLLLVVSETGLVYTFTTPKFQPIVTQPEGKNLIQACLNAPEDEDEVEEEEDDAEEEEEEENGHTETAKLQRARVVAPGSQQTQQSQQNQQQAQQHMQQQNQQQQAPLISSQLPPQMAHQQIPHQLAQQHQQPPQQQPQVSAFGNPAAYLNAEQAAVYHQYFNGVNSQQGQY
ncbi:LAFA_0B03356g1_1 [Lachancea sp. 'fantastica']|nr:LAFA_0B03356g1_1 [Lachancea sp. 'fantastica']